MKKKKLGIVSYLNVQPLIYGLEAYELLKETPYRISCLYRQKDVDCALLPVYELLGMEDSFVVDGISISSQEEAGSVLCFLNNKVKNIKKVALDRSSLSSAHLLRLIFKLYFGVDCSYETLENKEIISRRKDFDAYLLIGDDAIHHRMENVDFFDLGSIWHSWTGYPFVFAVWTVYEKDEKLKYNLLRSKEEGVNNLDLIIDKTDFYDKTFLADYYKKYLYFGLSDRSKESIKLYQSLLYKENFYSKLQEPFYY